MATWLWEAAAAKNFPSPIFVYFSMFSSVVLAVVLLAHVH